MGGGDGTAASLITHEEEAHVTTCRKQVVVRVKAILDVVEACCLNLKLTPYFCLVSA